LKHNNLLLAYSHDIRQILNLGNLPVAVELTLAKMSCIADLALSAEVVILVCGQ